MNQDVLISVIVPIYKVEAYLPKCVDSILNQTYSNLEVILVDDGSPDGCGAICEAYAQKDSRIRVLHKPNGGLSDARNAGIEIARGEFFSFIDADDWIEPQMYEWMLAAAKKHDARLVCAGRYDVDGITGEKTVGLCPQKDEAVEAGELVGRIFRWEHLDSAAWDKLYGRELFQEIRYPKGRVIEDVPTTYRIVFLAGKAAMVAKPVYNYLHRENSITTASVSEKTFHFTQHAEMVYADIRENHPDLEPDARYLWVRSVVYTALMLDLTDDATRARFRTEHQQAKQNLQANLGYILRSPLFTRQEKLTDVLMSCGLYRGFRKFYHALTRREV